MTTKSNTPNTRPNPGWFKKGFDPRRHKLTMKERREGGWSRWFQIMVEVRFAMGLPLPLPQLKTIAIQNRYSRSVFAELAKE